MISNLYGISHEIYSRNIPMFFQLNMFTCFYEICFSMKYTHVVLWNILTFFYGIYSRFSLHLHYVLFISVNSDSMCFIYPYPSGLLHWHWGNYCPSVSEVTLKNMGKIGLYLTTTKHKAWTMCIILVMLHKGTHYWITPPMATDMTQLHLSTHLINTDSYNHDNPVKYEIVTSS